MGEGTRVGILIVVDQRSTLFPEFEGITTNLNVLYDKENHEQFS